MTITVLAACFPRRRVVETWLALGWLPPVLRRTEGVRWFRVVGVGASAHGFGARPDWHRLGAVIVWDGPARPLDRVMRYLDRRATAVQRWELKPRHWRGRWGGRDPLAGAERPPARIPEAGPVAVVTHGAIPLRVLRRFWRRVPAVADQAVASPGYITGFGFGAVPLVALATFSVWDSETAARAFAWSSGEHAEVVVTTGEEHWFRESFFATFDVIAHRGPRPTG